MSRKAPPNRIASYNGKKLSETPNYDVQKGRAVQELKEIL